MPTPTEFPKYAELPTELRLQIVRQAAAQLTNLDGCRHHHRCHSCHHCHKCEGPIRPKRKISLGQYACIDLVWQDVIEGSNFKSLLIDREDIEEFGKTCHKRHVFLGDIDFSPYPSDKAKEIRGTAEFEEADINDVNDDLKTGLHALFNTMKDWNQEGRRLPGLIKLHVNLMGLLDEPLFKKPVSIDFAGLPPVSVIGSFQQGVGEGKTIMDPSSTIELCRKLPNLNHVSLNLFWQPTESGFLQEGAAALHSLRSLPYVPSKFSIVCTRVHEGFRRDAKPLQAQLPVLEVLTSPGPRWSDTITKLNVSCVKDVPQFIQQFQATSWPQLCTLVLHGELKPTETASGTEVAGLITQSLIGALSKMRKLVFIHISVRSNGRMNAMSIKIEIKPPYIHKGEIPFVLGSYNGLAQIRFVSIPGSLASQLQEVVQSHRGRVLEVFCMGPHGDPTGEMSLGDADDNWAWNIDMPSPFHRCKKWNRQKNRWDLFAAFLPVLQVKRVWVLVGESNW